MKRMRLLTACCLAWAAGVFCALALSSFAEPDHAGTLSRFIVAYQFGDVDSLPLAAGATQNQSDDARGDYARFFAESTARDLVLRNVRWDDERITADFEATVDGDVSAGSLTMYADGDRITRIVHEPLTLAEGGGYWADAGQATDKLSTAYALAQAGFVESNPLLPGLTSAGAVGLGVVHIAARNVWVRNMPLVECEQVTRVLSTVGWGAGLHNVVLIAGGSAAPLVGIAAALVAWLAPSYKAECVDGPVRVAELRVGR